MRALIECPHLERFELEQEHLIEGEAFFGDELDLFVFREVDIEEGAMKGGKMEFFKQCFGKRVWNGLEFLEQGRDEVTEVFRSETEGFGIDGDETSGMSGIAGHAFESGTGDDEAVTVFCHFSGDADFHALGEDLPDEFLVEPDEADGPGTIGKESIREKHALLETPLDGKLGECTGKCRLHSRSGFGEGKSL